MGRTKVSHKKGILGEAQYRVWVWGSQESDIPVRCNSNSLVNHMNVMNFTNLTQAELWDASNHVNERFRMLSVVPSSTHTHLLSENYRDI